MMKLQMKAINPKNLFRSKKSPSSSPPSFTFNTSSTTTTASSCSSSPSSEKIRASTTPTSVLIPQSVTNNLISSGEWSDTTTITSPSVDQSTSSLSVELVEALKLLDHDGDGKVTRREMETLLSKISGKKDEIETDKSREITATIDEDGEGACISIEELGDAIGAASFDADELLEVFQVFDVDHDGKISAEELMRVFVAIGGDDDGEDVCTIEECRKMIQSVDSNGDGFVCFEDFRRMMQLQMQSDLI